MDLSWENGVKSYLTHSLERLAIWLWWIGYWLTKYPLTVPDSSPVRIWSSHQRALLNFKLAISFEGIELDVEDYLEQAKIVQEKQELALEELPEPVQKGIGHWRRSERLQSEHPFILQRIKSLQEYAESETYQKLFESTD